MPVLGKSGQIFTQTPVVPRVAECSFTHPLYVPACFVHQETGAFGESEYWRRPHGVEWTDFGHSVKVEVFLPLLFKDNFRLNISGQHFDFM